MQRKGATTGRRTGQIQILTAAVPCQQRVAALSSILVASLCFLATLVEATDCRHRRYPQPLDEGVWVVDAPLDALHDEPALITPKLSYANTVRVCTWRDHVWGTHVKHSHTFTRTPRGEFSMVRSCSNALEACREMASFDRGTTLGPLTTMRWPNT